MEVEAAENRVKRARTDGVVVVVEKIVLWLVLVLVMVM
jgi:hypothetical protein